MRKMDEIKLNTFLQVIKGGSFTKASEQLYLSPISIKKQIDALEDELGEKLFTRKATGVTLTPAGTTFEKHAKKILHCIEEAKKEVEDSAIDARGEILAGHNITFNYKFVGSLSTSFSDANNNCIIQFQKFPRKELKQLLLSRQINCIYAESTLIEKNPEIEFFPLITLPVYAILNKNHPLAPSEVLSPEDLADQEIYAAAALGENVLSLFNDISPGKVKLIEETDRNTLFNRIIKGAVEIYPRSFSYYTCTPLLIEPVTIGIYVLKNSPDIIYEMIRFAKAFIESGSEETNEIM